MILLLILNYMKFTSEFQWLESFLVCDSFWLEDVITWDETFSLVFSEYDFLSFITNGFFVNCYFFLDSRSKISFLDSVLIGEYGRDLFVFELFNSFMWDNFSYIYNTMFHSQFLFYTDYQDYFTVILHHSPELSLALVDYIQLYWTLATFNQTPIAVFDLFSDSTNTVLSEFLENITGLIFFFWGLILFSGTFRLARWSQTSEAYWVRVENYLFSFSRTHRVQYEAILKSFFMLFLYFSIMIASFDDDHEEALELLNNLCFNLLLFFFAYFIYKYSIHFFAFLEATVAEGRSLAFAIKQCGRDIINSGSLLLRVVVLVIRLNIYDGVDDVLDSYYIFVADFDDDEYFNDLGFFISPILFFDGDVHDDRSLFLEDEVDLFMDLFSLYFMIWGKFALFIAFILEELGRVALALFITYLILFEVQAVNRSYVEDTFFLNKRINYSSKL